MFTFIFSLALLLIGYFTYSKYVDLTFGSDNSIPTATIAQHDGVDYMPLPQFKALFIQFLKVHGKKSIFEAIAGVSFGSVAVSWIILGCILDSAGDDYFSRSLSVCGHGESLGEHIRENL